MKVADFDFNLPPARIARARATRGQPPAGARAPVGVRLALHVLIDSRPPARRRPAGRERHARVSGTADRTPRAERGRRGVPADGRRPSGRGRAWRREWDALVHPGQNNPRLRATGTRLETSRYGAGVQHADPHADGQRDDGQRNRQQRRQQKPDGRHDVKAERRRQQHQPADGEIDQRRTDCGDRQQQPGKIRLGDQVPIVRQTQRRLLHALRNASDNGPAEDHQHEREIVLDGPGSQQIEKTGEDERIRHRLQNHPATPTTVCR